MAVQLLYWRPLTPTERARLLEMLRRARKVRELRASGRNLRTINLLDELGIFKRWRR